MYYDKRVRYIDYLENGEKRRNCGYVKAVVNNGSLLLQIQIKGLYETDDVTSEVTLEGAGVECHIGTVAIRQGGGSFSGEFQDPVHEGEELEIKEGLSYGRLQRIAIQLSPRRSLRCIWREIVDPEVSELEEQKQLESRSETGVMTPEASAESEPQSLIMAAEERMQSRGEAEIMLPEGGRAQSRGETAAMTAEEQTENRDKTGVTTLEEQVRSHGEAEAMLPEEQTQNRDNIGETTADEQAQSRGETAAMTAEEQVQSRGEIDEMMPEKQVKSGDRADAPAVKEANPGTMAMCEDKWQQLQRIYPHINPFQDEREYLSLRPEDFVILSADAYRLVRNSFLLHGYYNYKHLILTSVSQRGAEQYYIGVPGNFYEKEKQVAIMYGFSSFECKHEPAEEGDFGYYMIRVSI